MDIMRLSHSSRNVGVTFWIYVPVIMTLLLSPLLVGQPVALAQSGGLQQNPLTTDVTVLVNEGDALILQGQFEQAEAKYMEAVRAKPNDPLPYNRWSRLLLLDMKLTDAATKAQVAVTIAPTNAEAHFRLARALDWQGRRDEALAAAQQAITLDPANAEAHAVLAEIDLHLGRSAETLAEVTTALQLGPTNPEAYRSQALMLAAQGDYENAIQAALKAAQQQPTVWLRLHDLAEMLRGIGDCAQAITFYQSAITLHPEAISYAGMALCYISQGQLPEATTALQTALQLDPLNPLTQGAIGLLYATAGQCEQAAPYIRLALQLEPNQAVAGQAAVLCPNLGIVAPVGPVGLVATPTQPTISIAPTSTPTSPPPAPVATCQNGASYVTDVTVPDNSVFQPGAKIDKIWRLQNSGSCPWQAGYQLRFVAGDKMSAPDGQAVTPTTSGGTADILVTMYAPNAPGTYKSVWRMASDTGEMFGQSITVVIQVPWPDIPVPTVTLTSPPPPAPPSSPAEPFVQLSVDNSNINAGGCTTLRAQVENVSAAWLDGDGVVGGYKEKQVCPCEDRTYQLKATTPSGSDIYREVTVHVNGSCAPQDTGKPDLIVDAFVVDKEDDLWCKKSIHMRARIKNQGTATARGIEVQWWHSTNEGRSKRDVEQYGSLAPGETKEMTWEYTFQHKGQLKFEVVVDPDKTVDESNENNNSKSRNVQVGCSS